MPFRDGFKVGIFVGLMDGLDVRSEEGKDNGLEDRFKDGAFVGLRDRLDVWST